MTTFTITWNTAWEDIPADTDDVGDGDDKIREFKEAVRERTEVDHSWAGDANDGYHKKATLLEQGSDPAALANAGILYTKDDGGDTELYYRDDSGNIIKLTEDGVLNQTALIVGEVRMWTTGSAPTNWLLCDGSEVSRTTYAALFAVIGTTFGVGNGTTTFNLPDLRGRSPIGVGTGDAANPTAWTLAEKGGDEVHQLTVSEMPSHAHPGGTADSDGAHTHSVEGAKVDTGGGGPNDAISLWNTQISSSDVITAGTGALSAGAHTHSLSVAAQGGDGSHNNMSPVLGLNFIIYAAA